MDVLDALDLLSFLVPFALLAASGFWIAWEVWRAGELRRELAAAPPPGPDPALELERLNTETARALAQSRLTLEAARDAVRRGLKG
ncbi:MAG: hypothetical protein QOE90_1876 [Thermoplasmata archaeon]|nr:hypothetical protein [Thermoplasmata archaeon]